MARLMPVLMLAVGGAAGTLARVGVSALCARWQSGSWPWGTLVVNAAGCLLIGLLWATLLPRSSAGSSLMWLALGAGFCGAFTTFSSFALDSHQLAKAAGMSYLLLNIALHNLIGLLLVAAGLWLGGRLAGD